jgi:D-glycero-D-manno-heptose 1,7-bisphosphate phosphatase
MNDNRAVFLDRDGVINKAIILDKKPFPPNGLYDLEITENAELELQRLVDSGFILIGITNQPDVARGTQSKENVEAINQFLKQHLPIKDIYVCFHDDEDNCSCRKPKPGLILDSAKDYHVDISMSYLIGDRWKDIAAGKTAGCKTIFIDNGYAESMHGFKADRTVKNLRGAVDWILSLEDV